MPICVRRSSGLSLAEVLIVCAVLAIAAAVALPSAQPATELWTDATAEQIVQALRFARSEAMRAGAPRMVGCDQAGNRLSVYVPNTSNGAPVSILQDPLRKADYIVVPGQTPAGSGISLTACNFVFTDKSSASTLAFDAGGNPVRGFGDAAKQALAMTSGAIVVGAGSVTRTVAIDVNGRVTRS